MDYFYLKLDFKDILSNVISLATLLAVLVQSQKIKKQNSINTILILGKQLLESKRLIQHCIREIELLKQKNNTDINIFEFERYILNCDDEHRNYYNILDKICFCFLHTYIPEKSIYKDYEKLIRAIYEDEQVEIKPDNEINNNLYKWYIDKISTAKLTKTPYPIKIINTIKTKYSQIIHKK